MPFTQKIIDTANADPSRIAIADVQGAVTYSELLANCPVLYATIEHFLGRIPDPDSITTPDEIGNIPVIMIALDRAADVAALVAMLAGYRTVTSVLDQLWPIEHRLRAVIAAGAKIVITDDQDFIAALEATKWRGIALTRQQLNETAAEILAVKQIEELEQPRRRDDDEPFVLIFTSGTTDLPKGFLRSRHSWRVNVVVSEKYLQAAPDVRTLAPGPLAYSLTLYALVEVLATGGSIWLQNRFDAIEATKLIAQKQIERLVAVPAILTPLAVAASRAPGATKSLRDVIVGGADLLSATRQKFLAATPNAKILSYYGAAEIGFIGYSTSNESKELTLFDGVEVSVRDEAGNELQEKEIGTLFVRVASQGDRYISTAGDTQITGADGWATVLDQASMRGKKIILKGRAGDVVNTGGHKVSLLQVDEALNQTLSIEEAVAAAIPDKYLGQKIVAVVQTDGPVQKQEIMQALGAILAPQFVPRQLYKTSSLPKTVGGKVRRGEVSEAIISGKYERVL